MPRAGMKLAQWAGRGVRTVNDRAVITICDTRLLTMRYGRAILSGLPPFPVVRPDAGLWRRVSSGSDSRFQRQSTSQRLSQVVDASCCSKCGREYAAGLVAQPVRLDAGRCFV